MIQHVLTRQQSRDIDRLAIEQYGIPGIVLMENAGRGVVDVLFELDSQLFGSDPAPVTILCGKGNNAGDGFVIARHLEIRGASAQVILLASPRELQGDALTNYNILRQANFPLHDVSQSSKPLGEFASASGWILDAMLGTGAQGEPREPYSSAITWANAQASRRMAIDVPSGLDCNSGQPSTPTFRADHTCTFVTSKIGYNKPMAREYLGQLHVVSIGIPPRLIHEAAASSDA